jgi:GT2 family glycosyltransferase
MMAHPGAAPAGTRPATTAPNDIGTAVAVVIVSDYGGGSAGDWGYLRRTLHALASQSFTADTEVILVDSTPPGDEMPADVTTIVPSMRVIRDRSQKSGELVNRAARTCSADLVALLDADSVPTGGWLEAGVDAMHTRPNAAVVSGLTVYPGESFTYRVLGTLLRSFVDPGRAGPTQFITANNAIFRREVLLAHPIPPVAPRHLANRLQTEAIRGTGGGLYFAPDMLVTHRFDGWSTERHIRHRVGYRVIRLRQLDRSAPYAWLTRLGILSIPFIIAGRTLHSWKDCVRAGHHFGLRWFELPAAFAIAVAVHVLEVGGMMAAFREARVDDRRVSVDVADGRR